MILCIVCIEFYLQFTLRAHTHTHSDKHRHPFPASLLFCYLFLQLHQLICRLISVSLYLYSSCICVMCVFAHLFLCMHVWACLSVRPYFVYNQNVYRFFSKLFKKTLALRDKMPFHAYEFQYETISILLCAHTLLLNTKLLVFKLYNLFR